MSQLRNGNAGAGKTPDRSASTTDADLVHAARRGDKRAFVEIVARHQAMVCGVAFGILNDFSASEDAAQEAFLTAWRKIHDLREPERLRSWLGQIARNAALGYRRRERGHDPLEQAPALVDETPGPDEAAATEDEAALVRDSLAKLPEHYRLPLVLYYRDGQSVQAVATALDLSEDAVKQRLARGREMLRERMSGLIDTVLTRTGPRALFTMAIAVAIGALAAPSAVAGTVFAATSLSAGAASTGVASTSAASSTSLLTAMSTSKAFLLTAVFVTAVCIPVGYQLSASRSSVPKAASSQAEVVPATAASDSPPSFESSALFAEWRGLHEQYGTNAEAMPLLYKAIGDLKDPFRKRAFRSALISEWVQVDAAGGFKFMMGKGPDAGQRRQFFEEWLAIDARAAVDALLASTSGWESLARELLVEIARRNPARLAEIVQRLPKSDNERDNSIRDAFAVVAEGNLNATRAVAEALSGPNRDQALAGVAQGWAKTDFNGAVSWAKSLPEGTDRDQILRAALLGEARVNPVAALEAVELVPPGGRQGWFADTAGARVLAEAAKTDYDATVAWLAAHPGRVARDDLMGLVNEVTERLNADPAGFLKSHADAGVLSGILPAIENALLNGSGVSRTAVWEWLKTQPESETIASLQGEVLSSAAWQEPDLAFRLVADIPRTKLGDKQIQELADRLLNGGDRIPMFNQLLAQAPERLRQPLIEAAFKYVGNLSLADPQTWVARLPLLPESSRVTGVESIARAWANQTPQEAVRWATSLTSEDARQVAEAAIVSAWAAKDATGAASWVASQSPGPDRDRTTSSLVVAIVDRYPREAWEWALGISDAIQRSAMANFVARGVAAHDPETARRWIESGPFPADAKKLMQAALEPQSGAKASP
jgi:RNA polymerase sigma factor (sigma-70 family)